MGSVSSMACPEEVSNQNGAGAGLAHCAGWLMLAIFRRHVKLQNRGDVVDNEDSGR